mmetsp:Transcript_13777/g.30386  ORF Transcript_13777/g.30386 Transcript_13777/m.30386 type:complete len:437 (-) Transcript_13777:1289-2599(-)|eukprot:CAMPEP_0173205812 /NCGR_PEP_ID=MMETSP1141-20130122/20971_1 /TAXON_ID=483371 /ORGANISM="non described non described, Strain CCMP2298" /LENGTH=436 /DNA_ID=CAMNT_0014131799 /DNA_START=71 /DNA_END=1381 /DNA_ORIENTATION=+
MSAFTGPVEMNEPRFMALLEKLIGESRHLQNSPSQGLIPTEDLAIEHILAVLHPFLKVNGGVLECERVTFVEGRGNLILKYPGTGTETCAFVGSHMDVVPADPTGWDRDPFKLCVEGDMLYGRGTTDCLGHVALLTDLMVTLAETKPLMKRTIVVIFIANEENGSFPGVGVDQLAKEGYMDQLKNGPVFWIDAADCQPCIGTAGTAQWSMKAVGKLFHSGLPHKGMNSIELAMDAIAYIQKKFYADFPPHPLEKDYNFATQSNMKPTQVSCTPGSLNQLPPECTMQGDCRITPFYEVKAVMKQIDSYVAEINADPSILHSSAHGPHSKYTLPEEGKQGRIDLKWVGEGENGIACKLDSKGYHAILEATKAVLGSVTPYAIGGSLPLIRDLQDQGFDVQISGYGISSRYHADNEAASLSNLKDATRIISTVISIMER